MADRVHFNGDLIQFRVGVMLTYIIVIILLVAYAQPVRDWFNARFYDLRYALAQRKISIEVNRQNRVRSQQAEASIRQAKQEIERDTYSPFEIDRLLLAIDFYQESYRIVNNSSCIQAIENIQLEIDRRQQFQVLFRTATEHFHHQRFSAALTDLLAAQALYSPQKLIETIGECQEKVRIQTEYFQALDKAKELSYAGKLRDALELVNVAVAEFTCAEGENLQFKLSRAIAAREQLRLGSIEQSLGDLAAAKSHYSAAISLMPGWQEPELKIAIIELKTGSIDEGLARLVNIDDPRTKFLEGSIYTQRQEYQSARAAWAKVDRELVREYWQMLSNMTQEQQKLIQPQIKALVEQQELEQARTLSLDFIDKYGVDALIQTNLTNCILPAIETKMWATQDWEKIAVFARETWLNRGDIISLHNWAIALYYATQSNDNIEELIVAWATAIANIDIDPTIQDLPWLGTKSLSSIELSNNLWGILEQRIESIKEVDLPRYLHLRDRYRQELWAMKLSQSEPKAKIVVGEIIILPAMYQKYYAHIQLTGMPQIWQTLYTDWGLAVAACLAGDPQRSAIIQAELGVNSSLDELAYHFVLYSQGCDYLQQDDWRKAIYPLTEAKNTIKTNHEWAERIDILCANYRRKIDAFEEHLDFSKLWYDLVASPRSEAYAIEYQALKIHFDWYHSSVSDELSLAKIEKLLNDYPEHPIVREMFDQIYEYWLKTRSTE